MSDSLSKGFLAFPDSDYFEIGASPYVCVGKKDHRGIDAVNGSE